MQKIPSLKEIEQMQISETGKMNALNVLLNSNPPESWIRKHPVYQSVKYISIDKIEYLLTKIFVRWWVEILSLQTIANSAVVTVRLYYQSPIDNEIMHQDGCGAAPIHTKSGAGALDWNNIQTDSVMKAVPAAETFAIKDAAEKIGRIFGRDLNRENLIGYETLLNEKRFENAKIIEK
jgi:hypothetical protein